MNLIINQITLPIDFTDDDLQKAVAKKLRCDASAVSDIVIIRQSVDARKKNANPLFVLAVRATVTDSVRRIHRSRDIEYDASTDIDISVPQISSGRLTRQPVVVGAGPAGLMAAFVLAEAGCRPVLIERGKSAQQRSCDVQSFWSGGPLDTESNVLYGEGGAGLFSDGKLTARSKDRRGVMKFFRTLVECGAKPEILHQAMPHLGTDAMHIIIPNIRRRIESAGGRIIFDCRLEDIRTEAGRLTGVKFGGEFFETDACFLATGHSARDVYHTLIRAGVEMSAKGFAVGVRVELPQKAVDFSQFGRFAGHPRLGAANFRLTNPSGRDIRACYSFCMCPGGQVISCASSRGELTTNGMSDSSRGGRFANAAFLVPVSTEDFTEIDGEVRVLAGCEYQRQMEAAAFAAAGDTYSLPACRLKDFLSGRAPDELPVARSNRHAVPAELHAILPYSITDTLERALPQMLKKLSGVRFDDVLIYGPETRSSSPVRIDRSNETGESVNVCGLYPLGEGAGYAGGIVSSAIDGLRGAEKFILSRNA